jgi:hypothetical protein
VPLTDVQQQLDKAAPPLHSLHLPPGTDARSNPQFASSYVFVRRFLADAGIRVQQFCSNLSQLLLDSVPALVRAAAALVRAAADECCVQRASQTHPVHYARFEAAVQVSAAQAHACTACHAAFYRRMYTPVCTAG